MFVAVQFLSLRPQSRDQTKVFSQTVFHPNEPNLEWKSVSFIFLLLWRLDIGATWKRCFCGDTVFPWWRFENQTIAAMTTTSVWERNFNFPPMPSSSRQLHFYRVARALKTNEHDWSFNYLLDLELSHEAKNELKKLACGTSLELDFKRVIRV